jgi:chromosome segregation ATPase
MGMELDLDKDAVDSGGAKTYDNPMSVDATATAGVQEAFISVHDAALAKKVSSLQKELREAEKKIDFLETEHHAELEEKERRIRSLQETVSDLQVKNSAMSQENIALKNSVSKLVDGDVDMGSGNAGGGGGGGDSSAPKKMPAKAKELVQRMHNAVSVMKGTEQECEDAQKRFTDAVEHLKSLKHQLAATIGFVDAEDTPLAEIITSAQNEINRLHAQREHASHMNDEVEHGKEILEELKQRLANLIEVSADQPSELVMQAAQETLEKYKEYSDVMKKSGQAIESEMASLREMSKTLANWMEIPEDTPFDQLIAHCNAHYEKLHADSVAVVGMNDKVFNLISDMASMLETWEI